MAVECGYWVICDEYVTGPYTFERAERKAEEIARLAASGERHACHLEHHVVASATEPTPTWKQALAEDLDGAAAHLAGHRERF